MKDTIGNIAVPLIRLFLNLLTYKIVNFKRNCEEFLFSFNNNICTRISVPVFLYISYTHIFQLEITIDWMLLHWNLWIILKQWTFRYNLRNKYIIHFQNYNKLEYFIIFSFYHVRQVNFANIICLFLLKYDIGEV